MNEQKNKKGAFVCALFIFMHIIIVKEISFF
jgi:hypothetical protein